MFSFRAGLSQDGVFGLFNAARQPLSRNSIELSTRFAIFTSQMRAHER